MFHRFFHWCTSSVPRHHMALGPHVSLVSFDVWQPLSFSLWLMSWQSWWIWARCFIECPSHWVCLMFSSWLDWRVMGSGRSSTEVRCVFHHSISGSMDVKKDLSPTMLTLSSWLMQCWAGVSTVKLLFSLSTSYSVIWKSVSKSRPYWRVSVSFTSWREL